MTFFNSIPDEGAPQAARRRTTTGTFVGIGVPPDLARLLAAGRPLVMLEPEMIAGAGLDRLENPLVACMLLGSRVDALEVIAALVSAGYRGPLAVLAPPLPQSRMVEHELALAATGITVTLVQM